MPTLNRKLNRDVLHGARIESDRVPPSRTELKVSRKRMVSKKKIVLLAGTIALVGGTGFAMTRTSNARQGRGIRSSVQMCDELARALASNRQFIANERANPHPKSRARIANRQEVVALNQGAAAGRRLSRVGRPPGCSARRTPEGWGCCGPVGLQGVDGDALRIERCAGGVQQPVPRRDQAEGDEPGQQQVDDRPDGIRLR